MWITCLRYYKPDSSTSYAAVNWEKPLSHILRQIQPPGLPWCQFSLSTLTHIPLSAPNPALLSLKHNYPVLGHKARKDHPHCKCVWAGWHWGAYVVGEQGERWHREKHSCLSSCQAPAWCPETTLCSGSLNRTPQVSHQPFHLCQQSSTASPLLSQAPHPSCPGGHPAWLMHAANSDWGCHDSFFSIRFLHSICPSFGYVLLVLGFAPGSCLFSRTGRKGNI